MKVFIGCSSSEEIAKKYYDLAYDVASAIAKEGNSLVYGGTSYSMMGECYKAFADNKKQIDGMIAKKYVKDLINTKKSKAYIVDTTLERIARIYTLAEIFIILPGGLGTLEELFSILEENRTNKWKPIIIYNYEGYYDFIINWLNININTGFINENDLAKIKIVDSIEKLLEELRSVEI